LERVSGPTIAPDGSAWLLVRDQVKFGTSTSDGIYTLDPVRAEPIDAPE
jgi:hypothetical protein